MRTPDIPQFPYHRNPLASGSLRESDAACECCGVARGIMYDGNVYASEDIEAVCPWCIADGSAAAKFDADFIDGYFCNTEGDAVELSPAFRDAVFSRTIGFSVFNPIGWWVHCDEPAEFVERREPYSLVFECRRCAKQHIVEDFD